MSFTHRGVLLALAAMTLGGPAQAQPYPGASQFDPTARSIQLGGGGRQGSALDRLRQTEAALRAARQQLQLHQERFKVGAATGEGIAPLEAEVQQLEIALRSLAQEAEREALQDQLRRPVNVEFKDATLRQAAQALSRAADLNILVDERAPADVRFRVTAQGIPVWNILGTLASHSNLMIAPDKDHAGIRLEPWPMLEINGQKQVFTGPFAPWSNDWNATPDAFAAPAPPYGTPAPAPRAPGQPIPGTAPTVTPALPDPVPSPSQPIPGGTIPGLSDLPILGRLFGGAPAEGGLTGGMAVVGDRLLIIAEPGSGPNGEPGLWLTLYSLEMNRALKKVSTAFHPSAAAAAAAKRRPPTPPLPPPPLPPVPSSPPAPR